MFTRYLSTKYVLLTSRFGLKKKKKKHNNFSIYTYINICMNVCNLYAYMSLRKIFILVTIANFTYVVRKSCPHVVTIDVNNST